MIKLFKKTRIFLYSLFLKFLLWFMKNVWTSPLFMAIMEFLYRFTSWQRSVENLANWINKYIEDHIIYYKRERRIAVVVEADNAVGYSLCKKLVKKNYHIVMGVKEVKVGILMKARLLKMSSYADVTIVAIDMTNPMNVLYGAKRIIQNFKRIDVLYLNNCSINIDHINVHVLFEALLKCRFHYLCSTGRAYDGGEHFACIKSANGTTFGFSKEFCLQVLSPFILAIELKDLLGEADLPGRIIWTGSSTCDRNCFSFDDPQHIQNEESYYGHKYFVHLLQPALNEYLDYLGVQCFEGCPGVVITSKSPAALHRMRWLVYLIGIFVPIIQVFASSGARTLLHLGTHRNQYKDLEPNHMYIMRRRLFGLQKCSYVYDVDIVESRRVFNYLLDLYKKLKRSDVLIDGVTENIMEYSVCNQVEKNRRMSC